MFAHIISVWVCPKADPETRILVQVVWKVIPGHVSWRTRKRGREGKTAWKGCFIKQVGTGGAWAHTHSGPLGDSVGHTPQSHPTEDTRELSYWSSNSHSLLTEGCSLSGVNSLALWGCLLHGQSGLHLSKKVLQKKCRESGVGPLRSKVINTQGYSRTWGNSMCVCREWPDSVWIK